ncbi:MAG: hypothetical protein M2R45_05460 [Verrucomicrobia subdivision 3 bacterium]|nr:hypothetical protein [Limisphaerales bacterium]MCS1417879.1 hypothetical protein [Limisphaerales bacterium]
MISHSFTHYQTCFQVRPLDAKRSPLVAIQKIVFRWLKSKEKDICMRGGYKDFKRKCDWRKLEDTQSSVVTKTVYSDDFTGWALHYTHQDSELKEKRYWYTDIGVKEEKGSERRTAIFYVRISFARNQEDLSPDHPPPDPTTPRFIRDLIGQPKRLEIFSGYADFHLFDGLMPLKVGQGKFLGDWIRSEKRRYPMVVFNDNTPNLKREAEQLADDLAGKAPVLVLEQNTELAEEICYYLPRSLWIPLGTFRVFYPINPQYPRSERPERHRWFAVDSETYPQQRQGILHSLLQDYPLEEPGAITNIADIDHHISRAKLEKRLAEGSMEKEAAQKELKEFWTLLEDTEEERNNLKVENRQLAEEYDAKENELNDCKAKLNALKPNSCDVVVPAFDVQTMMQLPSTLEEVVGLQASIHADRLTFAEEAFASAHEYEKHDSNVINRAWEMIAHLARTLHELKFAGKPAGDLAGEFEAQTGYEYAPTEGKASNTKKIRRSRQIKVEGKQYEIWHHIKWGNRERKMLRVYFDFDEEFKKIIVGYVGPHLPNASS